ncbi:hypothetical protein pb186bvf_018147 [Paramecium bursaria]
MPYTLFVQAVYWFFDNWQQFLIIIVDIPQVMKSISYFYIIIADIPQVKKSISLRQAHQQLLDLQIIINNL